jgi:hypothetical protein
VKASLDIFINGLRRYKKSDEMINQNINFQTI